MYFAIDDQKEISLHNRKIEIRKTDKFYMNKKKLRTEKPKTSLVDWLSLYHAYHDRDSNTDNKFFLIVIQY